MASFIINTKAEFLKSRRTLAYRVAFLAGTALPLLYALGYIIYPKPFLADMSTVPWEAHAKSCLQMGAAFFPMYVTMITSLVVQTEYKNNTWKLVYTQPRSYTDIFFSKFLVIQILIMGSLLLFNISIIATGYIADIFRPQYAFFEVPVPAAFLASITFRLYVASLCITAIQYWLSLRFKNYITSLGIGIGLTIMGMAILKWDKVIYFPYAYPILTYFKQMDAKGLVKHEWYSLMGTAVALALGLWNMVRRKERG
jgi:hypothetical protein